MYLNKKKKIDLKRGIKQYKNVKTELVVTAQANGNLKMYPYREIFCLVEYKLKKKNSNKKLNNYCGRVRMKNYLPASIIIIL